MQKFQGLYKRSTQWLRILSIGVSAASPSPSFCFFYTSFLILQFVTLPKSFYSSFLSSLGCNILTTSSSWSTWNANWTLMMIAVAMISVTLNSTPYATTLITKHRNAVEVFVLGIWPSRTWFMVISFYSLCLIRTLRFALKSTSNIPY